jgi:Zn-dependent protease
MYVRPNISTKRELRDIIVADIILTIAIAFTLSGGIEQLGGNGALSKFILLIPISFVGVSLSFVLHELMHKFVAQKYGAIAGFQSSTNGLMITLLTGLFGFLIGIPGATVIYTNKFTKKENGVVSLAGPLTNFVVFAVFLAILYTVNPTGYLLSMVSVVLFISIILAFFNMLPIYPLDGSKVLAWNPPIYILTMGVIFVLTVLFTGISLIDILIIFIIALFFSMFYRNIL